MITCTDKQPGEHQVLPIDLENKGLPTSACINAYWPAGNRRCLILRSWVLGIIPGRNEITSTANRVYPMDDLVHQYVSKQSRTGDPISNCPRFEISVTLASVTRTSWACHRGWLSTNDCEFVSMSSSMNACPVSFVGGLLAALVARKNDEFITSFSTEIRFFRPWQRWLMRTPNPELRSYRPI